MGGLRARQETTCSLSGGEGPAILAAKTTRQAQQQPASASRHSLGTVSPSSLIHTYSITVLELDYESPQTMR